jgi:type IV pilus assembly protein PilO
MNFSDLNDLDFSNTGSWPTPIKVIAIVFVMAIVGAAGYWFDTKDLLVDLEGVQNQELQLKNEFKEKQKVVANIEVYRARLEELRGLLATMLEQLPTKTEMPDLLEAISDTGKVNGLIFDRFEPRSEEPKEFYAAVPIAIEARATYHQFGAFISSISALDRIVTLESASLSNPEKTRGRGNEDLLNESDLVIKATLQTYRYLDESDEEVAKDKKGI